MAITKMWAVKDNLQRVMRYAENLDKTTEEISDGLKEVLTYTTQGYKTNEKEFITGINCDPKTAVKQMLNTKRSYNKDDGRLAYHAVQSFKPGEVTPEQCHDIGVKLANLMWGDRFEVVVSTHLDKQHLHNHFVVNSVSWADGKKFDNNKERYGFTLTYFDASGIKQKETQLTLDQANAKYNEITQNIPLPFHVSSEDQAAEYIESYIRNVPTDIPSKQYQRRIGWFHNYIFKVLQDLAIKDIDQDEANAIITRLQRSPAVESTARKDHPLISKETAYRCYRLMQEAFEYLYINEVIDIDPFASIYIPKPKESVKDNAWTLKDFERITNACKDPQLFLFMHLLFYTGLSINEILGLQMEDVHVEDKDCYIVSKYIFKRFNKECMKQSEKNRIIASFEDHEDGKTTLVLMKCREKKKITIPMQLGTLLEEWIDSAPQIYKNRQLKIHPLFVNADGTPLEDCVLTKKFRKLTGNRSLTLSGLKSFGSKQLPMQIGKLYYGFSEELILPDDHDHFHDQSTKVLHLVSINDFDKAHPDQETANITHFTQKIKNSPDLKEYMRKQIAGVEYGKY